MAMSATHDALFGDDMMNFTPLLHQYHESPAPVLPPPPHVPPRLLASAARPSLSDAATREERKASSARTGAIKDEDTMRRMERDERPTPDASTEDDDSEETKRARVVFPRPETVQG